MHCNSTYITLYNQLPFSSPNTAATFAFLTFSALDRFSFILTRCFIFFQVRRHWQPITLLYFLNTSMVGSDLFSYDKKRINDTTIMYRFTQQKNDIGFDWHVWKDWMSRKENQGSENEKTLSFLLWSKAAFLIFFLSTPLFFVHYNTNWSKKGLT